MKKQLIMTDKTLKVVGKYAILLAIFYGLELIIGYSYKYLIQEPEAYRLNSIIMGLPTYLNFLLNIIIALIINSDKNRLKIEGKYSIILALIYRPIGIVLFLIYLINHDLSKNPTNNNK